MGSTLDRKLTRRSRRWPRSDCRRRRLRRERGDGTEANGIARGVSTFGFEAAAGPREQGGGPPLSAG